MHDGHFDLGGGHRLDLARTVQPPRTLGHEIAGLVAAVGPGCAGVQVGDRRVAYPWIGCGSRALCAAGQEHLCTQPRARESLATVVSRAMVVPHPRYLVDHGAIPDEQACTRAAPD